MRHQRLIDLGACEDAVTFASQYPTIGEAWDACERGDWMLWLAAKAGLCTREQLVLAACACARLALVHVPGGEDRPRIAIETAEAWADGRAAIDEVRAAADAAYAAAAYADDAAAYAAADAAAYAAYAAAAAYADDAAAVAAVAARNRVLRECADIVRNQAATWGNWRAKL